MFFRRVFSKNHHQQSSSDPFDDSVDSSDLSPGSPVNNKNPNKRSSSSDENQTVHNRGLTVLQLTPLWEHIIRTNALPARLNIPDMFLEFFERLHDPEWQVRQHALRVLVDVLIVMGQQTDNYIGNCVHPLVDNLGHTAPAVRKGALDALRVYVATSAMPEAVMLDILTYGMDRPASDPFSSRMVVAVMLAVPALILPVLITPKRNYVLKCVVDSLTQKMVQITYQEISLKILQKIKDMIGMTEFVDLLPVNVLKDFDLLCKVYGVPKSPNRYRDSGIDLNSSGGSVEGKGSWASRFVPKRDSDGNTPSAHAPISILNNSINQHIPHEKSNCFGSAMNCCDNTNNSASNRSISFDQNHNYQPKCRDEPEINTIALNRPISGILRSTSAHLLRSNSNLNEDTNGNISSADSSSSGSNLNSFAPRLHNKKVNNNYSNSSMPYIHPSKPRNSLGNLTTTNSYESRPSSAKVKFDETFDKVESRSTKPLNGKVIMETEIKISPEQAVTMRILEQSNSFITDDSDDGSNKGSTRLISEVSPPYPLLKSPKTVENPDNSRIVENPRIPENTTNVDNNTRQTESFSNLENYRNSSSNSVKRSSNPVKPVMPPRSNSVIKLNTDKELDNVLDKDDHSYNSDSEFAIRRTPRRVRFGGEIVKMRTPDSDTVDQSDVEPVGPRNSLAPPPVKQHLPKQNSSSSLSSESASNDYINQPKVGLMFEQQRLINNIEAVKDKKIDMSSYVNEKFEETLDILKTSGINPQNTAKSGNVRRNSMSAMSARPSSSGVARNQLIPPVVSRPSSPGSNLGSILSNNSINSNISEEPENIPKSSVHAAKHIPVAVKSPKLPTKPSTPQNNNQSNATNNNQQRPATSNFPANTSGYSSTSYFPNSEISYLKKSRKADDDDDYMERLNSFKNKFESSVQPRPTTSSLIRESSSFTRASLSSASRSTDSPRHRTPPPSKISPVQHSPMNRISNSNRNVYNASTSTDFSKELNIRIPDNETILPVSYTPPHIMIQPQSNFVRPSTSPMVFQSPKIVTIPATSSSNSSGRNSPLKKCPCSPTSPMHQFHRSKSMSPERRVVKIPVSMMSPKTHHKTITMMHNLQRSPIHSPSRRNSNSSNLNDQMDMGRFHETQLLLSHSRFDEGTQTPNGYLKIDEQSKTSEMLDLKSADKFEKKLKKCSQMSPLKIKVSPTENSNQMLNQLSLMNQMNQMNPVIQVNEFSQIINDSKQSNRSKLNLMTSHPILNPSIVPNEVPVETPKESTNTPPVEIKSWEELEIVEFYTLKDLKSGDWRRRSLAICAIEEALKSTEKLAAIVPYLGSLLRTLLTSEKNADVLEDQRRVMTNLISRLPLDNLEDRVVQIVTGLCRQGGAGANLVAKALMQRLPTASIVLKLLSDDFLLSRSSKFREHALQMVIFALMTFPSTYFDISTCIGRTTKLALDHKKRVRQAALELIAILGQITSPKSVIEDVSERVEHRKESLRIVAAVKARLARKQLPLVGVDGEVVYGLQIPGTSGAAPVIMFGSDVEWICSGSGSVSPTATKNRGFQMTNNDSNKLFEERRASEHLNRYAAANATIGSTNGTTVKGGNWSRIPVRGTGTDEDYNFVSGKAIQTLQRSPASTGRFIKGKVQASRSFPELSESPKVKSPVRQFSDTHPIPKASKLPLSSFKFPPMENTEHNNSLNSKNPYSFAPSFKPKAAQKLPNSSDGFYSDTIGTPATKSGHLESRPATHPESQSAKKHEKPGNYARNNSGRQIQVQPLTHSIALLETNSEQSFVERTKSPTKGSANTSKSAATTKSAAATPTGSNESIKSIFVDSYVEDQTRRNSAKTNSHILSYDTDDIPSNIPSLNSTPKHVVPIMPSMQGNSEPEMSSPTPPNRADSAREREDMQRVRNELAEMQDLLKNAKKEMFEIQKQRLQSPSAGSRPQSVNSNKTFIYDKDDAPERPKTSGDKNIEKNLGVETRSSGSSQEYILDTHKPPKPILKYDRVYQNEKSDEEMIKDDAKDKNDNLNMAIKIEFEVDREELEDDQQTNDLADETDNASSINPNEMRSRSSASMLAPDHETVQEEESVVSSSSELKGSEEEQDYAYPPKATQHMKSKNRPPVLKRTSRALPTKNILPSHPISPIDPAYLANHAMESKRIAAVKSGELFPPTLRKFDKPRDAMLTCLSNLDSSNWEQVMNGLQTFVRLIRHHPEYVDSQIHLMTIALSKHVKNLRSQVARAACTVSNEFFETHAKSLDQDGEELTASLLGRSADTNKFLRSDASKALEAMCEMLPPSKVIAILTFRGAIHQNAAVRCTTSKLLNQLVHRVGCDRVFGMKEDIRDKLIMTAANLLMEGSLDTRNYTKDIFRQLSGHPAYSKLLLEVIPPNVYRNIEKSLKSI